MSSPIAFVKEHPYVVGGSIVTCVLLFIYLKGKSGSGAVQNFTYSTGPSDAQVVAGTNLQIAQVQANQAASTAASNATAAASIYSDYFGYLSNQSANTLSAENSADQANISVAQLAATSEEYGEAQSTIQNAENVNGAEYVNANATSTQQQLNQQNFVNQQTNMYNAAEGGYYAPGGSGY